mmetsp:Transcript_129462/g.223687  ORF Transcript_129462/g.223687 Transcript_129462/m.223687 type:complete len:680 (+) Transcript_129462:193-2232(+)
MISHSHASVTDLNTSRMAPQANPRASPNHSKHVPNGPPSSAPHFLNKSASREPTQAPTCRPRMHQPIGLLASTASMAASVATSAAVSAAASAAASAPASAAVSAAVSAAASPASAAASAVSAAPSAILPGSDFTPSVMSLAVFETSLAASEASPPTSAVSPSPASSVPPFSSASSSASFEALSTSSSTPSFRSLQNVLAAQQMPPCRPNLASPFQLGPAPPDAWNCPVSLGLINRFTARFPNTRTYRLCTRFWMYGTNFFCSNFTALPSRYLIPIFSTFVSSMTASFSFMMLDMLHMAFPSFRLSTSCWYCSALAWAFWNTAFTSLSIVEQIFRASATAFPKSAYNSLPFLYTAAVSWTTFAVSWTTFEFSKCTMVSSATTFKAATMPFSYTHSKSSPTFITFSPSWTILITILTRLSHLWMIARSCAHRSITEWKISVSLAITAMGRPKDVAMCSASVSILPCASSCASREDTSVYFSNVCSPTSLRTGGISFSIICSTSFSTALTALLKSLRTCPFDTALMTTSNARQSLGYWCSRWAATRMQKDQTAAKTMLFSSSSSDAHVGFCLARGFGGSDVGTGIWDSGSRLAGTAPFSSPPCGFLWSPSGLMWPTFSFAFSCAARSSLSSRSFAAASSTSCLLTEAAATATHVRDPFTGAQIPNVLLLEKKMFVLELTPHT